jgi:hypothetical protein
MASREYYLKQAEIALRLARSSTDEEFSRRVLALAAEYQKKAEAAENDPCKRPGDKKQGNVAIREDC